MTKNQGGIRGINNMKSDGFVVISRQNECDRGCLVCYLSQETTIKGESCNRVFQQFQLHPSVDSELVVQKITLLLRIKDSSKRRSSPSVQKLACICNQDFSGARTVLSFRLISTPTAADEPDILVEPDSEQESYQAYHSTGTPETGQEFCLKHVSGD